MLTAALVILRVLVVAVLLRIAWSDLKLQKIANRDVLLLAAGGLGILCVSALQRDEWMSLLGPVATSFVLFVVLLVFWLIGTLGAGDVKLMAAVPLVTGNDHLLPFALFLLVFVLATVFLIRNPLLLPEKMVEKYIAVLDRKGIVPFGVPISMALLCTIVLQAVR
ncbi:prepilin peptidase [Nitratireductor sp. ZSWI3]|uniref:prepilin peptidase n=1 Tax=Nitratireductor sp. ZSWI3 TaxID=2966359 RepID=UPI00214FEB9F|nr:prepilin peptidase [Nitratireductor sp. ZSWI3]MCR4264843.1 prepilin peptidase [Nitratireductor sp. ZSWI3]